MLKYIKKPNLVILSYSSDYRGPRWVYRKIEEEGSATLRGVFTVSAEELLSEWDIDDEYASVEFKIADKVGDYYRFSRDILSLEHDLYIHKDWELNNKTFIAERDISVFSKIDAISDESIYLGGENENSIPEQVFVELMKNFPNSYELTIYADARVSAVISSYLEVKKDYEENYHRYMNKKASKVGANLREKFADSEIYKYSALLDKLRIMLDDEVSYSEKQWQDEILQIILLLYPKYIHVFKEALVRDTYNHKNRSVDFLLVDSTGNTDIIEIKKPFDRCIVAERPYRDNYIPLRELSGTVMQVEKYIFYLNKWGKKGEEKLTKKYEGELADGFEIRVTNPSGMIIMGRDKGLSVAQRQDFEIIKRKYKNVIDIITYDDLIGRLEFTIEQWSKKI